MTAPLKWGADAVDSATITGETGPGGRSRRHRLRRSIYAPADERVAGSQWIGEDSGL